MNSVTLSSGLVVYKDIINKSSGNYLYMVLRERTEHNKYLAQYIPVIKYLKYNKKLIKKLLELKIGDVISVQGELSFVKARISVPELDPPFRDMKKMIVSIKNIEWQKYIDISPSNVENFISIEDDSFLKGLSTEDIEELEGLFEEKLGVK